MRTLTIAASLALLAGRAAAECDDPAASDLLAAHVRAARWVDTHTVAGVLLALCPDSPRAGGWRLLDALALDHLDEPERARDLLASVPPTSDEAPRARTLLAWSYLRAGDRDAFRQARDRLAPEAAARLLALASVDDGPAFLGQTARLDATLRRTVLASYRDYRAARGKSAVLAGLLSALLPGAGQAYTGSWQGAAVSFVLSGVLIGATVELARHDLPFSAGAAGLAASVFYVGNIMNAADAAGRANDVASAPARRDLERLLLPEAQP